jgi:hypothetical protein
MVCKSDQFSFTPTRVGEALFKFKNIISMIELSFLAFLISDSDDLLSLKSLQNINILGKRRLPNYQEFFVEIFLVLNKVFLRKDLCLEIDFGKRRFHVVGNFPTILSFKAFLST